MTEKECEFETGKAILELRKTIEELKAQLAEKENENLREQIARSEYYNS